MTNTQRTEKDMLGERCLPSDVLYGIHALRARENFALSGRRVHPALIHAFGAVKLACIRANHAITPWQPPLYDALEAACAEMIHGELDEWVIADALSGGAGTSVNMNINEVIANRALVIAGYTPGEYTVLDPHDDINRHQSTNDTYPTALKVAAILSVRQLARALTTLQEAFQHKEHEFRGVVKIGRTEMQDAVLTTLGREMGAYAECLARDRWRVFKCEERLRVVNLGGTAIGTGIGAPRAFIFNATEHLREITGIGLSRAENLVEATQNTDVYVEVSGILKAAAANIMKICGDLRFLSSGPEAGIGEITLPRCQAGSSIMPGKVNPVIAEAATQAAIKVMGNDQALSMACGMGHLELNAFMPLIAELLLENITLLSQSCDMLAERCVNGISAVVDRCKQHVDSSTAILTALVEALGYEQAVEVAHHAEEHGSTVSAYIVAQGIMTQAQLDACIAPERVMRIGSQG